MKSLSFVLGLALLAVLIQLISGWRSRQLQHRPFHAVRRVDAHALALLHSKL